MLQFLTTPQWWMQKTLQVGPEFCTCIWSNNVAQFSECLTKLQNILNKCIVVRITEFVNLEELSTIYTLWPNGGNIQFLVVQPAKHSIVWECNREIYHICLSQTRSYLPYGVSSHIPILPIHAKFEEWHHKYAHEMYWWFQNRRWNTVWSRDFDLAFSMLWTVGIFSDYLVIHIWYIVSDWLRLEKCT